ncbi:MAG: SEC-C metal-binding domain-containing protein [Deltaproteobacteria bacterium]|nr:SEC-C metal-binding domain-containing protein [Deltaproteobacteria bacterium]
MEELNESREKELDVVHSNLRGSGSSSTSRHGTTEKIGRNAPCPCGSGKKYKKCCGKGS